MWRWGRPKPSFLKPRKDRVLTDWFIPGTYLMVCTFASFFSEGVSVAQRQFRHYLGTVTDPTGAVIAGVNFTVTNTRTESATAAPPDQQATTKFLRLFRQPTTQRRGGRIQESV